MIRLPKKKVGDIDMNDEGGKSEKGKGQKKDDLEPQSGGESSKIDFGREFSLRVAHGFR